MCDLENVGKCQTMYNVRSSATPWQIMTTCLMTIAMFAISLAIYEIFTKQIKFQKFDFDNVPGQEVEKLDLRHSTGNVRFRISDFLQNFSYVRAYVYAKRATPLHIHRQTRVMTIGKICKADLPKKHKAPEFMPLPITQILVSKQDQLHGGGRPG